MISRERTTGNESWLGPVLLSRDTIAERVTELAARIDRDYADRDLVLVPVLKGAAVFAADLSRALRVPHEWSCVALDGYEATRLDWHPTIRLLLDVDVSVEGRDIVLVEDVVDTGMTLNYLITMLELRQPRSIQVCTLLDRNYRRLLDDLPLQYVGFSAPDKDVVGYGMARRGQLRHLADLHQVGA